MLDNFKNLIRRGDKFIFVEDGKPAYVVMHYEDYEHMLSSRRPEDGGRGARPGEARLNAPERQQTAHQGAFSSGHEQDFNATLAVDGSHVPEDISKIRLEDLPL
ncbi:MAG: hypothetical protein A3B29_01330 [Candidatus Sungbacteria bacterium RIFCSPLOWO2_01_FULL_51_34]|nr:MAG: hypothetical protein A3B29_01330 [Candidatus Sungbacteria bacterium RIFCSPLOWO2_01_FULL_51_34]